ncbi:GT4 family glycosyltransferase PelF [Bradyrhizobium lablabi]|uniref:GT4 family glycosyltransferase PelF n=1 Tax=Bradyrhizobium lablabi TaxID=722472 RepID=UPI001BAA1812|nr:GT4 family glycosyltransferase PelF [Bradyrhizobium lablabi]MBR1123209.1 GT4 family glycosyltransferase PelF [Bradyrhizobium lablabi]
MLPSPSEHQADTKQAIAERTADVCLIVEGGYPYTLGGVASWSDALMRASPNLTFHVIAISISSQPRRRSFVLPNNVLGVTDILLDVCPRGRIPTSRDGESMKRIFQRLRGALTTGKGDEFAELVELVRITGLGRAALLDSKEGWRAMEEAYESLLPNGPLLDFFWSWRFLVSSVLAVISTPLPSAHVFHAVATGFAGIVGSYAKVAAKAPLLLTEHGIYTNERRIELAVSDWLFDSGAGGYVTAEPIELRSTWLEAFKSFSKISYDFADIITTQYRANQNFQRHDGAPDEKLRIVPNGIDVAKFAAVPKSTAPRSPTVLMIGRIVPIKDVRSFIMAVALLKERVPDVVAILIGPEDEDPEYATSCHRLVDQLGVASSIQFPGRVPDVLTYLGAADVLALSSISEAQPIAMLEAAAVGIPIVSTDVGSCREILEGFDGDPVKGRGGFVVEPCNPTAMAEALATILRDRDMQAEMANVMRRRVASYYHKDRVRALYEGLYSDLAARSITYGQNDDRHQYHN